MAKILHIMLSKGKGGIQQAALSYARLLDQTGHVTKHILHADSGGALKPFSAYDPFSLWALVHEIKTFKPELIISHGRRAAVLAHWAKKCAKHKTRHVHVLHRYRFKGLSMFDAVWCVNAVQQSFIPATLPATTLPLWLETLPAPVTQKSIYSVGFLGRLVPEKGADILIEALRHMPAAAFGVKACIGGTGPQYKHLVEQVKAAGLESHVDFIGWVENKTTFFENIDVLCVPSRWESFGLVVLEAWAHGVPVVALAADGPKALITNNVTGLLCEETDLTNTLRELILSPELQVTLRQGGLQAVQNYTAPAALPRLQQALEAALHINPHA